MKLTDIVLRNLPAPEQGQKAYPDDSVPGFGVRVSTRGTKTFTLVHGRSRERTTIGRYPVISLAEARTEAKRLLAERTLGRHQPQRMKFEVALSQFFTAHLAQKCNPRTEKEVKRLLNKHLLPKLKEKKLREVSTQDVMKIVDGMLATPGECDHLFRAAKTFFRWTVRRRLIPHSPLEGLEAPVRMVSRDRVLSDDELTTLLIQTGVAESFGAFVRLLILTGQRKGEIASLRGDMIDTERRTISLPMTKNRRPHTFPFGDEVAAVLATLPTTGNLFPGRQASDDLDEPTAFNGFSKAMDKFRNDCGIAHWTLHDLRRTFATGLQRLGVRLEVIEALLNHLSGTRAGIVGVYQRHSYVEEMRAAQALWEKHIASLSNVGYHSEVPGTQPGAVAMAP
jgi:integrase